MRQLVLAGPVLFAIAFVLSPYAVNSQQVLAEEIALPLGIAALAALILVGSARRWCRDDATAAVTATAVLFYFIAYGPLAQLTGAVLGLGRDVAASGTSLAAWTAASALGAVVGHRLRARHALVARLLLIVASVMLLAPVAVLTLHAWRDRAGGGWRPDPVLADGRGSARPDVYFIVLDGYGRADVLRDKYGHDNSEFLDGLGTLGFRVDHRSVANYAQTHLSLASSLNMCYLDGLAEAVGSDASTRLPLLRLISENRAASLFRSAGYRYITLSTGYLDTELSHADDDHPGSPALSQFSVALLGRTPLAAWPRLHYGMYRRRLLQAFDRLGTLARDGRPMFVVAHITVPHHPFVYAGNGDPITPARRFTFADDVHYYKKTAQGRAEYARQYVGQLRFVNAQVAAVLASLLAGSSPTPIVVLQGDHGPSVDWAAPDRVDVTERMPILSAVLLPASHRASLHEATTPVNTLRAVANISLGIRLPLVADKSYYSSWSSPYAFRDVTDLVLGAPVARTAR